MLQRWSDVTPDVLGGVGVRSVDFIPDGVVRLVDKNSNEIITDLNEAGLQCGIFFVRTPVSTEASRRILTVYQTQKTFVLLITERDLDDL